jgi:hypothetical protein
MSYSVGGIGLPHLDGTLLSQFIEYVVARPNFKVPPSDSAVLKDLATRLTKGPHSGGLHYDDIRKTEVFSQWMLTALSNRDAQRWILEDWLNSEWMQSYREVLRSGGSAEEALVNVRIRSSGSSLAMCALQPAKQQKGTVARIRAELESYATPGGCRFARPSYAMRCRPTYMLRPVVLLDALSPTDSGTTPDQLAAWPQLAASWRAQCHK